MAGAKYKFVGPHAADLASGQLLEPGEFVTLTDKEAEDPHNQALMAEGWLIGTGEKSEDKVEGAEKKVQRETKKAQKEQEEGGS